MLVALHMAPADVTQPKNARLIGRAFFMVIYDELFLLGALIASIISLVIKNLILYCL